MSPPELETNPQTQAPRVSIGLAVYNGEKYLEQAIQSILAQTFTDFELIISDNASTDRTAEICRKYAAQDARIRYSRNPTNIGGANNENLTFTLSRGEYFRWAAHDDLLAPTLLEKCVEVLDHNPDVVLCHSVIIGIDENGSTIKTISIPKAQADTPSRRFRSLIDFDHDCEQTYGLIRSSVMRKTLLQLNYTDSDRTFLAELSLHGRFYQISEHLFYKRYHPDMSTRVYLNWRDRMLWFDESYKDKITFPNWSQFLHHLMIIWTAPISILQKSLCYFHMVHWIFHTNRWRRLIKDPIVAARKKFYQLTASFKLKFFPQSKD